MRSIWLWYRWTAPESGIAHIGICCSLQTPVGVYAGDALSALTPVASGAGRAEFATLAGETYRIAVDGKRDSSSGEAAMGGFSIQIAMSNLTAGPGA
ncbi:MAG TPA: hypothetical protein VHA54_02300, partial [Solirubrobacterales bacterium]|nr:hypothetical protein [Solirubrobacterales bacterium]